ncbi:MAG: bifunctional adenosylcobinamide kinase/adenosylcobinamide-phosphate guanylyltransferase [Victivallaceae bacterium]|nr:bifunctional adenosylcobinamide kinase/adenosylcobinamide-phosphate guanylyltransferase [Victivallaceae bacterium]
MNHPVPSRIILVTGGARSGKSTFAENLVKQSSLEPRFYIATAPVLDEEMADRVKRHRARREGEHWTTIEEECDLEAALDRAVAEGARVILVDCLTLWIGNLIYRDSQLEEAAIAQRAQKLAEKLRTLPATTVLVINEVGMGIVPEHALSRRFRDLSGRCGQILAAEADEVYLLVAGIALSVKKTGENCHVTA